MVYVVQDMCSSTDLNTENMRKIAQIIRFPPGNMMYYRSARRLLCKGQGSVSPEMNGSYTKQIMNRDLIHLIYV